LLSNPKYRMTRQRQVILEELRKANSHLTADEVYQIVRRRLPRISLGTVYRNLEVLSESGVIKKLELGGTQKLFDGKAETHYHARCIRCGRVDDVPGDLSSIISDVFRGVSDYEISGHELVLTGLCPDCKSHREEKE
jgi:Fur family ferric uptake transcriptional regulator